MDHMDAEYFNAVTLSIAFIGGAIIGSLLYLTGYKFGQAAAWREVSKMLSTPTTGTSERTPA